MTCAVDDCERPAVTRGLCRPHYERAWELGTIEVKPRWDPVSRFLSNIEIDGTSLCWTWTASRYSGGYGCYRSRLAHRWSYEHFVGPIPEGLQLDHLCRNRACVNPDHLEPVTPRENWRRGIATPPVNPPKTHCKHGHEFTDENTYNYTNRDGRHRRACRTCARLRARDQRRSAA